MARGTGTDPINETPRPREGRARRRASLRSPPRQSMSLTSCLLRRLSFSKRRGVTGDAGPSDNGYASVGHQSSERLLKGGSSKDDRRGNVYGLVVEKRLHLFHEIGSRVEPCLNFVRQGVS